MAFTEDDLKSMGLVQLPDGTYGKPRKEHPSKQPKEQPFYAPSIGPADATIYVKGTLFPAEAPAMRKITLTLFGIPMPKQSVRSFYNESLKRIMHYQPKEMEENTKRCQVEVRKQLPKDFVPFANEVHITKLHFVFPPLKAFQKIKGRMDDIHNGKTFYKNTKPDADNCCKFCWDFLKGVAFTDDNIIVSLSGLKKIYGTGGATIIEMEGW